MNGCFVLPMLDAVGVSKSIVGNTRWCDQQQEWLNESIKSVLGRLLWWHMTGQLVNFFRT